MKRIKSAFSSRLDITVIPKLPGIAGLSKIASQQFRPQQKEMFK